MKGNCMNKQWNVIFVVIGVVIFAALIILINSFVTIQPGQIGLRKFLGKLLVDDFTPGFHVKIPLTTVVTMTTKFNQLTVDSSVLTEDNLNIQVEATILYKINPVKSHYVYSNFGNSIHNISVAIMNPALQSSVREACSIMDWDTLSTHREKLREEITKRLKELVEEKGFILNNVMINDIQPPQKIKDAVMAKLQAQQEVVQMQFEMEKAKKEAQIKVIDAQGIAKAQEIIQKRLTPLYVQYFAIQSYRLLANSKNTTFVVMPTSATAAGMPMILNANK